MRKKKPQPVENPKAFPRPIGALPGGTSLMDYSSEQEGMDLRDYFAGQALKGMLSSPPIADRFTVNKGKWSDIAYEWADAMLRSRVARHE